MKQISVGDVVRLKDPATINTDCDQLHIDLEDVLEVVAVSDQIEKSVSSNSKVITTQRRRDGVIVAMLDFAFHRVSSDS